MSTTSAPTPPSDGPAAADDRASGFSLDVEERTLAGAFRGYIDKIRSGDPGALPSVLGVVVLVIIFSQVSSRFLTKANIGNLPGQGAYIAIIGMGLVFVLLLGEIDLSAGTTGGMAAGFAARALFSGDLRGTLPHFLFGSLIVGLLVAIAIAVWLKAYSGAVVVAIGVVLLLTNLDNHPWLAMATAVCIGAAVGIFIGFLVAKVGIPSFIVTLALFLAWQGVLLFALNSQSINTSQYELWFKLTHANLSPTTGWIFTIVVVGAYAAFTIWTSLSAQRAGLAHDAMSLVLGRAGILAVVALVLTFVANQNRSPNQAVIRGIPWAVVIVVVIMIVAALGLTKTTWGRHLYATGGNQEAARRAGIDVVHIKVTAFTLCSAFGAFGGIMLSSASFSVSLDLGAGNILLFSVAAAVIGGTSLFGGRGKPSNAVIGALVIVIIPNGLGLRPNLGPQYQQVITGVVLLVAAAVDAVSRKRGQAR